jgi:hypothetical protein
MLAIETLLDFEDLSIEVTGRLKAVQDSEEAPHTEPCTLEGKLLYTVVQWRTFKYKAGAGLSKDRRRYSHGGKNKPKGDHDSNGEQANKGRAIGGERRTNRNDTCLNCNRSRHWAKDCPFPRHERSSTANVAEAEEAALFLVHEFLELVAEGSDKAQASTFCTESVISLDIEEPQSHAFLNISNREDKLDGWYLDSGTTYHMTGHRELFTSLSTVMSTAR